MGVLCTDDFFFVWLVHHEGIGEINRSDDVNRLWELIHKIVATAAQEVLSTEC